MHSYYELCIEKVLCINCMKLFCLEDCFNPEFRHLISLVFTLTAQPEVERAPVNLSKKLSGYCHGYQISMALIWGVATNR